MQKINQKIDQSRIKIHIIYKFKSKQLKKRNSQNRNKKSRYFHMDLSTLLAQTQMSYSKMNFYKSGTNKKDKRIQQFFFSAIEQNFDLITSFLSFKDTQNFRLVCRNVGYLFIARDLWGGIKRNVADIKFQDFDDYEFVEEVPKQISKEDKKIRIHSLKKNLTNNSISKKPKRQASNIKQKKMAMSIVQTELNPFQRTEMGFKRLLKTVNPSIIKPMTKHKQSKNVDIEQAISFQRLPDLLQIPSQYSIDDLIINPNDQWVKNMQRANNLVSVVRRWLSFNTKFWTLVNKLTIEDELIMIMKKVMKMDGSLLAYKTTMEQEPYCTIAKIIFDSAPKNALIQEQLNKLGKQFISNHQEISQLIDKKQTEQLITVLHESYQKITQKINRPILEAAAWAQGLSILDETYDNIITKVSNEKLKIPLLKSLKTIFKKMIDQHLMRQICFNEIEKLNFRQIRFRFLIENAEFCQFTFQILYNLVGKLSASNNSEHNEQNVLGSSTSVKQNQHSNAFSRKLKPLEKQSKLMSTTLSKFKSQNSDLQNFNKSQKALFGILWNISKYFDKLQKQLIAKESKKKEESKVLLIKQFLQNQSKAFSQGIPLIGGEPGDQTFSKNLSLIEEYYKQFKTKIQKLKDDMAKVGP